MTLRFRPLDYVFILGGLVAVGLSALAVYRGSGDLITIRGAEGSWVYPRNAVERVLVPGPLGETVVELGEGRARVLSSPCANQLCVAAGSIHSPGQWVACLPNQVLVILGDGGSESGGDDLDASAW